MLHLVDHFKQPKFKETQFKVSSVSAKNNNIHPEFQNSRSELFRTVEINVLALSNDGWFDGHV